MLNSLGRTLSPGILARSSASHPWRTVLVWVVVFLIAGGLRGTIFDDVITTKFEPTNTPESRKGDELLEDRLTGPRSTNEVVIVQSESLTVADDAFRELVETLHSEVANLGPSIIREGTLTHYYDGRAEFLVSEDRRTTIIPFTMAGDFDDASDNIEEVVKTVEAVEVPQDLEVLMTGFATVNLDFRELADEGLLKGEAFAIPIALVILVLVLVLSQPNCWQDRDGEA